MIFCGRYTLLGAWIGRLPYFLKPLLQELNRADTNLLQIPIRILTNAEGSFCHIIRLPGQPFRAAFPAHRRRVLDWISAPRIHGTAIGPTR
jgi:hypothetical protein